MVDTYVPEKGDVVWSQIVGAEGHEQKGRRPFIIVSPKNFNQKMRFCFAVPITSKKKCYNFEIEIQTDDVQGVVLTNQIISFNWPHRDLQYITRAPKHTTQTIVGFLSDVLLSE